MKLSARNVLKGKIIGVKKGAPTAHVPVESPGGAVILSSTTNEAVEELQLMVGGRLCGHQSVGRRGGPRAIRGQHLLRLRPRAR
jgi:molybdopterin-binding protein